MATHDVDEPQIDPDFDLSKIVRGYRLEVVWDIVKMQDDKNDEAPAIPTPDARATRTAAASAPPPNPEPSPSAAAPAAATAPADAATAPAPAASDTAEVADEAEEEDDEGECEPCWYSATVLGPGSRPNSFRIQYDEDETNEVVFYGEHLLRIVSRTSVEGTEIAEEGSYTVWRTEGDDYEPPTNAEEEDDEPEDVLSTAANIRNMVTSIVWNILRPLPMDKQLKVAEMVSATVDDFSLKLAVKKHEDRKRLREGDDAEGEGAKRRQTEPLEITAEDVREVFSEIQQVVRAG